MVEDALKLRTELPRPDVSAEEARALLAEHYGLSGTISELGSQQDRNEHWYDATRAPVHCCWLRPAAARFASRSFTA